MEKVLARRDVNRRTLDQYVLDETESFEILGPGRWPLHRTRRDYTWYVRDGMHVRSPVRFNGVKVGDEARDKYETNWIQRERGRQERRAKRENEKEQEKEKESGEIAITAEGVQISTGGPGVTEPRFVSEAYFMDFKFEPGNYYLAGREQLEGQQVLKVEYYPTKMFGDSDDDRNERQQREQQKEKSSEKPADARANQKAREKEKAFEQDIERRMNKTALITLWIDPREHQIVKYTFDNVWLDFLPAGWLVKVDDIRASMTMGQPFPGGVAAARAQHPFGRHAGQRFVRGVLRAHVQRVPAGRSLDEDAGAEEGAEEEERHDRGPAVAGSPRV